MERFMPKAPRSKKTTRSRRGAGLRPEPAVQPAYGLQAIAPPSRWCPKPETCASCGGTEFEAITPELLDEIANAEGGTEEETTYDGRKLRWTQDARKALRSFRRQLPAPARQGADREVGTLEAVSTPSRMELARNVSSRRRPECSTGRRKETRR